MTKWFNVIDDAHIHAHNLLGGADQPLHWLGNDLEESKTNRPGLWTVKIIHQFRDERYYRVSITIGLLVDFHFHYWKMKVAIVLDSDFKWFHDIKSCFLDSFWNVLYFQLTKFILSNIFVKR